MSCHTIIFAVTIATMNTASPSYQRPTVEKIRCLNAHAGSCFPNCASLFCSTAPLLVCGQVMVDLTSEGTVRVKQDKTSCMGQKW
jgi:hypothetical protein